MEAPGNWSGVAVGRLITALLEQTREAPGAWRAVGEPFEVHVCMRADGWAIRGRAPAGHVQTYVRQDEEEASAMILTCIANELHYGDLDRGAVVDFAQRIQLLYG